MPAAAWGPSLAPAERRTNGALHKLVVETEHEGLLLRVGGAPMPALNVLIVRRRGAMSRLLQALDKGAGVVGMDAVIARRGGHEKRRVARLWVDVMIGRVAPHEVIPVRRVGVAVLGHPRGTRQQLVIPAHVQEGDGAHDGPE